MNDRKQLNGHLSAFITIFIWATTFISTKILLKEFSPVEIIFFRLVIAYCVLFVISPHFIKYKNLKEELLFLFAGLCGVTFYFLFQNFALSYTFASNVSVLISISPFFTALISRFFMKDENFQANFFFGFAISIIGIFLIGFNGNFILKLNPLGDILAILSALIWAIYSVLMKKISNLEYNTVQFTRKIFFYGLLLLIPALNFFDFRLGLNRFVSVPNLLNILFLGIGASALCYVTWNYAVSVLGAVKTSVYIYLIPIITIVFSALILHEKITLVAFFGVLLILFGLFISERKVKAKVTQG
jgi:drug/metabolite transporter (DMT)-like permease